MCLQRKLGAIACPVELLNGCSCGQKCEWTRIVRSSHKLTFLVATCKKHGVIAVYCSVNGLKLFKWAKSDFERMLKGLGKGNKRPRNAADRCTACNAQMRALCSNWMCKKCCTKGEYDCTFSEHYVDKARPMNPRRNLKDHLWKPEGGADGEELAAGADDDHEVIVISDDEEDNEHGQLLFVDEHGVVVVHDDDSDDDAYGNVVMVARMPSPGPVPGPSRLSQQQQQQQPTPVLRIQVTCEHEWEANAARESGSAVYTTHVTVPATRGDNGPFLESDLTAAALVALKLAPTMVKRLLIWDAPQLKSLLAFPGDHDDPYDGSFASAVKYNAKHRISFVLPTRQDEIHKHVELMLEEIYCDLDCDWFTLRDVLIAMEVQHHHTAGRVQTVYADCYARRRRFHIEHCKVSLSDLRMTDLIALELVTADLSRVDDGAHRPHGITFDTLLEAVPFRSQFGHELKLVVRVHGSKIRTPKRRKEIGGRDDKDADGDDDTDLVEERASKRHKTVA
ncbi:hypothetical protein AURDEDRAFT_177367 [Auricularia subglabra TFB-10046 SS5]|uniref:Uncharacterized protein n=1 Tax=Auricularia subglabra (strain TFB-10046 / SS5) TaxID=717982 RepID=J0LAV8_AURST|nr:hypothetical protein AURDEDRAFT_177367 [Auricularia subglabra TFB-10046 SS5]